MQIKKSVLNKFIPAADAAKKVTFLASAALILLFVLSTVTCSSDDNKSDGYLSCSEAEAVADACEDEADGALAAANIVCGNDPECQDEVGDNVAVQCYIRTGLCKGDASKTALENKEVITKCLEHYKKECGL